MCLVLIAINQHPLYPLMILSNRDEFYGRASASADFWNEDPNVFAGKDLVKGGTWLGVTRNGNFSFITNYRNPIAYKSSMLSRGLLVKNYLLESENISPLKYIEKIAKHDDDYNGFNLMVGNINEIYYYSNIEKQIKKLSQGIYCLSNHLLNTLWYKVERARTLFIERKKSFTHCHNPEEIENILSPILSDTTVAPDDLLPQTGVGTEIERYLSPIFVDVPNYKYGTYCSNIILIEKNKNVFFSEKIFKYGVFESHLKQYLLKPT